MQLPEISIHHVGAGVVVGLTVVLVVLVNRPRSADSAADRYEAALAAIQLGEVWYVVVAGALVVGIGTGLVLGGLWAYHAEVSSR